MQMLITSINARFAELQQRTARIDTLEQTIVSLEAKITDLEDRSRRSNLLVFGVQDDPTETENDLKDKVLTKVFSGKLGVPCKSVGRIHRLGKPGKDRPIIIYFQDFNEKELILKNAHKLKGTQISVQSDYSKQTLRKRKLLWESARNEKLQGKKVHLSNDRLRVDKETYIWDDKKNCRVKLANFQSGLVAP